MNVEIFISDSIADHQIVKLIQEFRRNIDSSDTSEEKIENAIEDSDSNSPK